MNSDVRFYVSLMLKRLPLMLSLAIAGMAIGIWVALSLPPVYTSSSKLLVEQPQIPDDLASSTVQTGLGEQLGVIRQKLLTRANLLNIARRYNVFENMSEMTPDEIVSGMTSQTVFNTSTGRDQATTMYIAFNARSPRIATDVTNAYVTSILDENVRLRTSIAEETLNFFKQEVQKLGTQLDDRGARIIDFQNQNLNALPEGQTYRQSRLNILQERLSQLRRDIDSNDAQRQNLIALYEATGRVEDSSNAASNPVERQLAQARADLASAQLVYSDNNPQIRLLQKRVDQIEAALIGAQAQAEEEAEATDDGGLTALPEPGARQLTDSPTLNAQLVELDTRRKFMEAQIPQIEDEMVTLEEAIQATPANAVRLEALKREYENTQEQYRNAIKRLNAAETGERIELSSRGQRISVIEQPTEPSQPTSPNRKLIAAAGGTVGLAAGIGLIFLLEFMNGSIRRPSELTRALGITPLATIPYMPNQRDTARRLSVGLVTIAVVGILCVGALYVVDQRYLPLETVWARVQVRLGI
ncbi:LPS biosynthesis protein [Primorskyibacter flagellatus]|uniref:LPS biosynthesis protein n=1 Tax=Primorskyibacter flagellatus TaxID=1387277 RepID=A0A917AEI9_9RHOB|nr:lipopolysaccharide biosynthesis [Primorskyibacter flagellatus]GGE47181.1 LPS biosynthesis protein [Primorskyibacter flagellatus]